MSGNKVNANTLLEDLEEAIKEFRKDIDAKILKITALTASSMKTVERMKVGYDEYSGPVQDGLPHGQGKWVTESGADFKRTWLYGKREGLHLGEDEDGSV